MTHVLLASSLVVSLCLLVTAGNATSRRVPRQVDGALVGVPFALTLTAEDVASTETVSLAFLLAHGFGQFRASLGRDGGGRDGGGRANHEKSSLHCVRVCGREYEYGYEEARNVGSRYELKV